MKNEEILKAVELFCANLFERHFRKSVEESVKRRLSRVFEKELPRHMESSFSSMDITYTTNDAKDEFVIRLKLGGLD